MNKKIIFSGGGTGGHIFPAINLLKHFFDKEYKVILVTDIRGNNFIKDSLKLKSYVIRTETPTNKSIFKKFFSFFFIFYSILKSIIILKREKPDLIFGFGGYVSFPICFAAKLFNIPLAIYENNMVLGRANKYLSFFAKKIFLAKEIKKGYPEKYVKKTHIVGPILNKDIINYPTLEKNYKKEIFSVVVLGGSQGAEIFGSIVPTVIKMVKEMGYKIEISQQCLVKQKKFIMDFYNKNNIKNYVFDFEKDILKLISSSDLAITRCGASTTAELAHLFTPFIAIPLPNSVDNHQYLNAKYYEDKGCCWILEQSSFNNKNLFNLITEGIKNKNKLEKISENMKKNHKKDVYANIENNIKEII
jgi:UDP-N-acetylglucosamine--N-acetylmuramyl-(pentapeptide) pyrophosphoryl-undecaprenol N-acetylglucosamine transferase